MKFVIGDSQLALGVGNVFKIELVHNQYYTNNLQASVVSPFFSQTVCAKDAMQ